MLKIFAEMVLLVMTMLVVVPTLTSNAVSVPSGRFFRGLLAILVIAGVNWLVWAALIMFTVGSVILANWVTFGLVALLVNALSMPIDVLVVGRGGGSLESLGRRGAERPVWRDCARRRPARNCA